MLLRILTKPDVPLLPELPDVPLDPELPLLPEDPELPLYTHEIVYNSSSTKVPDPTTYPTTITISGLLSVTDTIRYNPI